MEVLSAKRDREAAEAVKTFIQEFHAKFGILPRVNYSFDLTKFKVTLAELEDAVNYLISKDPSIVIEGATVRTKKRLREIVVYRQAMFKIANEIGYGPTPISTYFGWNHATVIYSCKNVSNLIQSNDKKLVATLSKIENELEKRFGIRRDVQSDSKGETESKSVLPVV